MPRQCNITRSLYVVYSLSYSCFDEFQERMEHNKDRGVSVAKAPITDKLSVGVLLF